MKINSIKGNKSNRKIFIILIGIILMIFTYAFTCVIPDIFLHSGKQAYNNKNYQKAYSNLDIAVKLNKRNRDARYYFVQTLIKMRPTLLVQRKLFELSQNKFSDSADVIAEQQILKWRDDIFANIGDNYIENVPFNNKILRWDTTKLPLNVNIQNLAQGNIPQYYMEEIRKAFIQWQESTDGLVKFNFIDNPKQAQILVKIISDDKRTSCKQEECKYVAAYTEPTLNGDLLSKMTISLYDVNGINQYFTQRQIYNIVLHEIGHSLGIMGHSQNKDDLMYMERNPSNDMASEKSDFQLLSQTDLNTINLLYKLVPDITNTSLNDFNTNHQFYAPIVMGSETEIGSRKELEAKNYIKGAPNLPNGYIALSEAYVENQEYGKAIEALNKALSLSSTTNEKFVIYYNMSIIYMNVQDWDNSLKYAQMAKQLRYSSASDIDGLIAAINFNKGNKEFAKNAYEEALKNKPGDILNSVNLAKIYIKEFNFIKAGDVLNNLVQANPDAKNDPKVKPYGLLMFFFK